MKMVEITEKVVKHDSKQFFAGERRYMEDEEAAYFIKHGWGHVVGENPSTPPVPSDVTLDVHNSKHPNKTKVL